MEINREQIINELYNTKFVENYCFQLATSDDKEDIEDIIQEIWLIISEISEDRLINLYKKGKGINGVRRFVAGIISRQIRSTTSLIHKKYRIIKNKIEYKPIECLDEKNN